MMTCIRWCHSLVPRSLAGLLLASVIGCRSGETRSVLLWWYVYQPPAAQRSDANLVVITDGMVSSPPGELAAYWHPPCIRFDGKDGAVWEIELIGEAPSEWRVRRTPAGQAPEDVPLVVTSETTSITSHPKRPWPPNWSANE